MNRNVVSLGLILATFIFLNQIESSAENGQAGPWDLKDLQTAVSKSIMGGEPGLEVQQTAEKGIYVEIWGWISARDLANASIKMSQITLSGSSKSGGMEVAWKVHPHGLGMVIGPNRFYELPHAIVKGMKTVEHDISGKYRFGKDDIASEATLILLKNPTYICLAFVVPEQVRKDLKLTFSDTKINLTLNSCTADDRVVVP